MGVCPPHPSYPHLPGPPSLPSSLRAQLLGRGHGHVSPREEGASPPLGSHACPTAGPPPPPPLPPPGTWAGSSQV